MSRVVEKVNELLEENIRTGYRIRRNIGNMQLKYLDPFLLLDEFKIKKPAGFPDHPHKGFENVTYMLDGTFTHEDSCGSKGVLNPGDLQWLTMGRGIQHCIMPKGEGIVHGLNLWVNLSKKNKMMEPASQELRGKDIPRTTRDGVTVTVIAGKTMGMESPIYTRTPTMFLDFKLPKGTSIVQTVPEGWNTFVYVLSGSAIFGPNDTPKKGLAHHILIFGPGHSLKVSNKADESCHFVLIAGKPLNESVVLTGQFAVNNLWEIQETKDDIRLGRNGFEASWNWQSSAVKEQL